MKPFISTFVALFLCLTIFTPAIAQEEPSQLTEAEFNALSPEEQEEYFLEEELSNYDMSGEIPPESQNPNPSENYLSPIGGTVKESTGVFGGSEIVPCFDYYKLQSVGVSFGANKTTYRPGDGVNLKGQVVNNNDYPIINGNILIRIGRRPEFSGSGNELITEFYYPEIISLSAHATKTLEWVWTVPSGLVSGEYEIQYFFLLGDQLQISGLPFTNEVIGGNTTFSVESTSPTQIYFLRDLSKVNGEKYTHVGEWPYMQGSTTVSQTLYNPTNKDVVVSVLIKTFAWSGPSEKNLRDQQIQTVTVPALSNALIEYKLEDKNDSIYYVTMQTQVNDAPSFIASRILTNKSKPRFNFASLRTVDVSSGEIISCFHNMAEGTTTADLSLSLFDKNGNELGKYNYTDMLIEGNPGALLIPFKDIDLTSGLMMKLNLLDKSGNVLDTYSNSYDCKDLLNQSSCDSLFKNKSSVPWIEILIGILIAVLLVVTLIYFKNRPKKENLVAYGIVFLLFFGLSTPVSTEASSSYNQKTKTSETSMTAGTYVGTSQWQVNFSVSALHRGGMISGDYVNQVGDEINFLYHPDDPFFHVTSSAAWCPYGLWVPNNKWVTYSPDRVKTVKYLDDGALETSSVYTTQHNYYNNSPNVVVSSVDLVYKPSNGNTYKDYYVSSELLGCNYSNGYPNPSCALISNSKATPNTGIIPRTNDSGQSWYGEYVNYTNEKNGRQISVINSHFYFSLGSHYPNVSLVSNNPAVISCNGMKCTANSVGNATITMNISSSLSTLFFRNTYLGANDYPKAYGTLPSNSLSWDLTVQNNLPPVPGACGTAISGSYVTAPMTNLCGVDNTSSGVLPNGANWNWSCTGNYGGSVVSCSAPRVVSNLTAYLTPTSNDMPLVQGNDITFNGRVFNGGTQVINSAFSNNFTYRWGSSGAWLNLGGHMSKTIPLAVGATQDDTSTNLHLVNTGTLQIQHCVDSQGQINEENEGDNCLVGSFNVIGGYSCTNGPVPANAIVHTGDDTGLSANVSYTYSLSGTGAKCEYHCNSGYNWNGSACIPAPSANINANPATCNIVAGQNTCTVAVNWTTTNVTTPSIRQNGIQFSTDTSNPGIDRTLSPNTYTFAVYDGVTPLDSASVTVQCAPGYIISNAGVCENKPDEPSISIEALPKLVRRGNTTKLDIDITSTSNLICKLYGATANTNPVSFQFNATTGQFTGISEPYTTKPLQNTQDVTVVCEVDGFSSVTGSDDVTIDVIGSLEEI